ncbi:GNAT family N-acetyltransferase [Mycolicibacterium brumae]|uniref:N-acetyltransferase n=1 Tax=Mycolicibacterium brumae TaxID=85968 RepID=A0A2G5PCS4_9MYCO|nr:GNAT family N-acetyltransferase [Mycolicibacterium brumae]MCV7193540.1 GNAT family N-acetyltransferase [Mycolicibacterium brumae]PIB76117.1 N-acetyltransferase [Mycolicibacterium brumae]RWA17239.1 hypothetical protein MBRU_06335 [Mycolicibacterium brumae DSM 44177]UWW09188.1 GNAT family N-acetyltransferase [Mycolicibacterium brumae]
MPPTVERAHTDDVPALAELAALTFPLACPPRVAADDVAAFIAENLSRARFSEYLADSSRTILVARDGAGLLGYTLLVAGEPGDPEVAAAVTARPVLELSKMYAHPDAHGSGVAAALMGAVLDHARAQDMSAVWLGVNQQNTRALRFYRKQGFAVCGERAFTLGGHVERDFVMSRPV